MKKKLLLFAIILQFAACKKTDPGVTCYECNFKNTGYQDVGCFETEKEWNGTNYADELGNEYSKNTCRKKR